MDFSKTQLANYATVLAGIVVLGLALFGVVVDEAQVAFIIYAVFSVATGGYSFYQRFNKGDLTLGGVRIKK